MNSRSKIMPKAGQRKLERSRGSTSLRLSLEHVHLHSGLSENQGCGKTIRPRADHAGSPNHRQPREEQELWFVFRLGILISRSEVPSHPATQSPAPIRRTLAQSSAHIAPQIFASTTFLSSFFQQA